MKVSIFIASCFRPKMFDAMLRSLEETTAGYDIETVVVVDEDVETLNIAMEHKCNTVLFSRTRQGAPAAWNRAMQLSTGDILVPTGDDHLFHPDWLKYALESHQEKLGGYGVCGMNDLAYNGNTQVATMWIFDRQYCKDVMGGIFAPPMYRYYCIDSEWNEKSKPDHFYWDERAIVEHLHSAHGKRPMDSHDKSREGMSEQDNKTFANRKERGFPVEWSPLI